MPLSPIQEKVLRLIAGNRSKESHIAGATGIHLSPRATRVSHDLDLFHDSEVAVAEAFRKDSKILTENGYQIEVSLSQPGFIRAHVTDSEDSLLVDWAHDSVWRFFEPVQLEEVGWVLHPVDLAVNKVLALAGRDEPRDFLDILYLHKNVLSLGALLWSAAGKDPGMNPAMLLELLKRKGRITKEEIARLDLRVDVNLEKIHLEWKQALKEAGVWIRQRPPEEAGCLYTHPETGRLFVPENKEPAELHRGKPGGVLPRIHGVPANSFCDTPEMQSAIESFFMRKLLG